MNQPPNLRLCESQKRRCDRCAFWYLLRYPEGRSDQPSDGDCQLYGSVGRMCPVRGDFVCDSMQQEDV